MNQLCFEYGQNPITVRLIQTDFDRFTVRYGKQIKTDLNYSDAAHELGACLMHYAACDGRLDSRDHYETEDTEPYFSNPVPAR